MATPTLDRKGLGERWQLHGQPLSFLPLKAFNEAAIGKERGGVGSLPLALDHLSNHMLLLALWEWFPEDPRIWVAGDLMRESEFALFGALEAIPNLENSEETRRIATAVRASRAQLTVTASNPEEGASKPFIERLGSDPPDGTMRLTEPL